MKLFQKKYICLGFLIGIVIFLYFATGIGCPILYTTGIPCLGCGMSRACLRLMQLDFYGASHYHPLCFVLPLIAVFLLLRFYGKISEKQYQHGLVFIAVLFSAVYLIRLKNPADDIVKFHLRDGFIYRNLQWFFQFLKIQHNIL